MALSLSKILIGIVVVILVLPILGSILVEYGTPQAAQSIGVIGNQTSSNFTQKIYNPLANTSTAGLNQSNQLAKASAQFGFVFAFILPSFGNFITSVIQAPVLYAGNGQGGGTGFLTILLSNLGFAAFPLQAILTAIFVIMFSYVFVLGVQSFMKTPLWS